MQGFSCCRTYDRLYKEAMTGLSAAAQAEDPRKLPKARRLLSLLPLSFAAAEQNAAWQQGYLTWQDLAAWTVVFLQYLQAFRKLQACSTHMVQAQKRRDVRRALEACLGRMLEVRRWMVCVPPSHAPASAACALCILTGGVPNCCMHATVWR